jgi:hypothetical protein
MSPGLAVITTVAGRPEHLARQRRALVADGCPLHVLVEMAGPTRRDPGPPTERVAVPAGPGGLPLAAARNAGAAAARAAGARTLVFLDVDCVPERGLTATYAAAVAAAPEPALLCGPVHYLPPPPPGGYPEHGLAALAPPHPARPVPAAGELRREDRFELFWSLSFAVGAGTWERLGGFCEQYRGYGGEDTDFAFTARDRGARLYWAGGAVAYHQHHEPSRDRPRHLAELVGNARLFHRRWGSWPMGGWLRELHDAGAVEFDPDRGLLRTI